MALTPTRSASSRRQAILTAIRQHFRERGLPPSYREIAERVGGGLRARHVAAYLAQLEHDGLLGFERGKGRSIALVDRGAGLSDIELEAACRSRGWRVTRPPAAAVAMVDAYHVEHRPMDDMGDILTALDSMPPV